MIEMLLGADRLLRAGSVDQAERIYAQVAAADPRNAMAIVGLAMVAQARGDADAALACVRRALEIDPDDAAAQRLMAEFLDPVPNARLGSAADAAAADGAAAAAPVAAAPVADPAVPEAAAQSPHPALPRGPQVARAERGWLRRLLARFGIR